MPRALSVLLALAGILRAEDPPAAPLNPNTTRAIQEFQAGNKAAACASAGMALAQNPKDEKALGISHLTCGTKAIDGKEYKERPDPEGKKKEKTDLKPKPFSGKANEQPGQQPQQPTQDGLGVSREGLLTGGMPGENIPSNVITAPPTAPGLQDQPTTFDKLQEAQRWLAQGKPAEAALAAREAVRLQPRNRRAYDAWAEASRELRDYDAVMAVTELGLKTFPDDPDLLKNRIFALNKKKDYAAAIALADEALLLHATDAALMALKAYALGRSGDKEGMVKTLETAAALDPNFEPLLMDARASTDGEPFLMPGDFKEAPRQGGIPAPKQKLPVTGLLIFGGLIVLLGILAALILTGAFKHNEEPPAGPPAA